MKHNRHQCKLCRWYNWQIPDVLWNTFVLKHWDGSELLRLIATANFGMLPAED